jgi:hypothetical protein
MRAKRARRAGRLHTRAGSVKVPLLLLALIVLVGGLIWLALDRAIQSVVAPALPEGATSPEFRFVKGGGDDGATVSETMVWLTSTALEDCAQVRNRRNREVKRRLEDLLSSASPSRDQGEEDACAPFQLGKVAAGTRVEILGECGEMTRVKISSGRLQGQQGCIENDRLEDRPARSEESSAGPRS